MAEAITLKELIVINQTLSSKAKVSDKEFYQYVKLIKEYIDINIIESDIIIERLLSYAENSGRTIDIKTRAIPNIELSALHIHNYLEGCKKSIEKALYVKSDVFNLSIFVEIKSTVRYYLEKTYEFDSLTNYQTLFGINTVEFHQQNETFKYLYSVFDKFTYIAKHLNNKYVENLPTSNGELGIKFFSDFVREISFLAKSAKDYQALSDTISKITDSTAWHFVRKLRNIIEHDFTDPSFKYNITFATQLLFILTGRIMLSLSEHLMSEQDMRKTLENLKKENN